MAAFYEYDHAMTDAETLLIPVSLRDDAGNPPVWDDLTYEYSLTGCGVTLTLTAGDGITIDDNDILWIGPADRTYRLPAGNYRHGFRMTHTETSTTSQWFDGDVSVSKSVFTP